MFSDCSVRTLLVDGCCRRCANFDAASLSKLRHGLNPAILDAAFLAHGLNGAGDGGICVAGQNHQRCRAGIQSFSQLLTSHDTSVLGKSQQHIAIPFSFRNLRFHTVTYYNHFSSNVNQKSRIFFRLSFFFSGHFHGFRGKTPVFEA